MSETLRGSAVRSLPRRPAVTGGGLRLTLRAATADAHTRLDARLAVFDLADRDGYRRFLIASAAALLPLEAALSAAGIVRLFPDWPVRTRGAAILSDLALLGAAIPPPLAVNPPSGDAALFGTLYVLEGSRLGARLLHSRVAASPDPVVRRATSYLGHGAGEKLWPSFVAGLERAAPMLDRDLAIAAARRAFDLFARAAQTSVNADAT